jgi:hypothetical protein
MKALKRWREPLHLTNNCSTPMNFKSSSHSPLTKEMLPPLFYIIRFVERVATILGFISPVLISRKLRIKNRHQIKSLAYQLGIIKSPSILGWQRLVVSQKHTD